MSANDAEAFGCMVVALFPTEDANALTLLKGHLVIENRLASILKRSGYPLKEGQPRKFRTLLERLKKCKGRAEHAWVWTAIKKLDDARNHLAHDLQAPKLQAKLGSFISCMEQDNAVTRFTTCDADDSNFPVRLKHAIAWLWEVLGSDLIEEKSEGTIATVPRDRGAGGETCGGGS